VTRAFGAWALALVLALAGCEGNDVLLYGSDGSAHADTSAAAGAGNGTNSGGLEEGGGFLDTDDGDDTGGSGNTGGTPDAGATTSDTGAASGAGNGDDAGGTPCTTNADCPPSWFCSKQACEDSVGTCFNTPIFCPPDPMPVCGCDHVSYWNTCVRQSYGVGADRPYECGPNGEHATPCFTNEDCIVPGLTCAHLLQPTGDCSDPGPGACWGTPPDCSNSMQNRRYVACPPPPDGSAVACISACDAIQSGDYYVQAPRGMPCE
jgi:hypothetical protein